MKDYLSKNHTAITSTITSIVSVLLAILANELYKWFSSTAQGAVAFPVKLFISIMLIVGTVFLFYITAQSAEFIKSKIWPDYIDDQYMKHAFLHIKRLGSNRQETFQELQKTLNPQSSNEFLIHETVRNMQLVVQSCYDFFDSAFTKKDQLVDNIKFESTFMTKSYRDQGITIPCSANKENRTPISMLNRENNPAVFANTETAKIYKMDRPIMVLVEDTSKRDDYIEIYSKQKARIKSSVILPVLSHENALLGTLVVHCNQAGFFRENRYQFWNELLEMFSVELGYQKLLLDYYITNSPNSILPF